MKKILMITGSLRKNSINRQLAMQIAEMLDGKAEVRFLEFADLPFMNQDIEFPPPKNVIRVRRAVQESDAVWIVSSEYNFQIPGVLKNLLDWLSRPLIPNDPQRISAAKGKLFVRKASLSRDIPLRQEQGRITGTGRTTPAGINGLLLYMNCTDIAKQTGCPDKTGQPVHSILFVLSIQIFCGDFYFRIRDREGCTGVNIAVPHIREAAAVRFLGNEHTALQQAGAALFTL